MSLIVTDCIQGLISYPIFVIFTVFVLTKLSFFQEVAPVMLNRVEGESFLNPFDIAQLRDFNLFALFVTVFSGILNRASWIGNDTSGAARTPHEQKMAGILGTWRNGFSFMMCLLIAITVIAMLNHGNFSIEAGDIRANLTGKAASEVISDTKLRSEVTTALRNIQPPEYRPETDAPLSRAANPDTIYLKTAHQTLQKHENGNALFQEFRTLYYQMMLPVTLRHMFPTVLMGLFCLLMVLLMLTTDDSRIFNASSTIIQDVVMPLRKVPFTKKQHLKYLRICSVGVCVFFFIFSLFMSQLDYINMFLTIMSSIWLGGAGPVMIFGLYSRFGTTAGAWASLLSGAIVSVGGWSLQHNWANFVYPLFDRLGWVGAMDGLLRASSAPFAPYIEWAMDPVKFPINSREIYFFAMASGIGAYIVASLLTRKEPFNLERMLHRGQYRLQEDSAQETEPVKRWTLRHIYDTLIGITPEYSRGDKIINWSVISYSIGYQFILSFLGVVIWNAFSPIPPGWWAWYFFINNIVIAGVIGAVSTVWFFVGGLIDMRKFFRDLAARKDNPLNDGWVENNISAADRSPDGSAVAD